MARKSLKQRQAEWRPGQVKAPGSVRAMFASTVLLLEAFVVLFFMLAMWGLSARNGGTGMKVGVLVGGLVLAGLMVAACAFLRKPWGYAFGWALQIALVCLGFFITDMFWVGACFLAAWWYAMVTGVKIDREKKERFRAEQEYDRQHGRA